LAGIKPLLIGLLLSGLFAFALITAGITLSLTNHASHSIGDDPAISAYRISLNNTLNEAQADANSSLEAIGESSVSILSLGSIVDAVAGIWKTLKVVPVTIYNLTIGLLKGKVFGSSFNVVFGIMGAILIILIIFGVIKLIFSGQDE
jgi:hypothetical protein